MKKINIFASYIFLLFFCYIFYVGFGYCNSNTLEAATMQPNINLEELASNQKKLTDTVNALQADVIQTQSKLELYQKRFIVLENNLSTTQTLLVSYYIDKLSDPTYITTYNEDYTWYTAAEALGELGKPAIPALIKRLDTSNPYEKSLVFYALLLASQAENVKVFAGNDYIHTYLDFDSTTYESQTKIALKWWEKYKDYF